MQRPKGEEVTKEYDNTEFVAATIEASQETQSPPIPDGGIPAGWTMEQWEYYGHEHLEKTARGEA